MKLFLDNPFITSIKKYSLTITLLFILNSCATHHAQYGKEATKPVEQSEIDSSTIAHTFYLVGDAGNADEDKSKETLALLENRLEHSSKNSTLLFLGDNIYPKGFPNSDDKKEQDLAKTKLTNQLQLSKNFKGKTIFIPGNHDWYSGIKGLERQAKFITNYLDDKKAFLPQKNCAIDDLKINATTTLVTIDSQWFLEDWDDNPTINDDCTIKTREDFFDELESILNKNQDKTVIIAIHHPLMTNGSHGGQYSVEKELFPLEEKIPLPVIGSFMNLIRKTSGVSPQDIQNKVYNNYVRRIKTLLHNQKNVIVVSGHDHNLQYISKNNIHQIISGAGSKSESAKAVNPDDFSYGGNGYAELMLFKNGNSKVSFYGNENHKEKLLFEQIIIKARDTISPKNLPTKFPAITTTSIYSKEMTQKNIVHKFLFGQHYRKYYSLPVEAKTATLDTLFGGVKPVREGGGHQSNSLRLVDAEGKEYAMRALKKSTSRFFQSVLFKDQFVSNQFKKTYAEDFLYDFYTTSHPYTPLAVGSMADKIGVPHTNPNLYYIPKQKTLKKYNSNFGDELYLIEEQLSSEQKGAKSLGNPLDIISTDDLMKNMRKDEKYTIDEPAYIKARLFDMLIGDWDRHSDQWRWGEYKENGKVIYKPIPRDRDQAFTKYDGALMVIIMTSPLLRHQKTFKKDIRNVKWLNREPYSQDIAFLKTADEKEWLAQAKYIQEHLTDKDIDNAFVSLPKEVQDETIEDIKRKLKTRKNKLQHYAKEYYEVLQRTVLVVGTDKKDKFIVNHISKNNTEIAVYRVKKEGDELLYTKKFNAKETKNIWVYGLDDDDIFEVKGNAKSGIKIKLIGGQNNDSYTVENGKKLKIYDFKSKPNSYTLDSKAEAILTDDYETNLYDYEKVKYNVFTLTPWGGYNPDDGVKLGAITSYTVNNFNQHPFSQKHTLKANYFFATSGYEFTYNGIFPQRLGKWNFEIESKFTSPNFTINYFGYGNETINSDQTYGLDYNRVRLRTLRAAPSIKKTGRYGSEIGLYTLFEKIKVEETTDRYINIPGAVNPNVFDNQQFVGGAIKYSFENYDVPSLPTMGFGFSLAGSWKMNVNDTKANFPTLETKLNFNHKIDADGQLVLATILKSKVLFNNNFEFYQGATLGGDYDLRGFRNERFLGKSSFYQSTDLRWNIGRIKKSLIPMTFGILGGFDYGRIWLDGENSNKWHQSAGGGIWINGLNVITGRITYFKSGDDKARIAVGIGYGF
ncbi:metallophosphoesterase [Flavobacterium sp. 5]|uniref:metallophosphoesterase n=1 Tax=Flavobacterium sp. 5 TaxID=2035199 RepID=UPI000C2BDF43|nr:metallophosphoesterase [Flavobacterium sp. 5]PKB18289.1 calcineurin-like phosphoesterase family protein [Flavobacterium sp. 5]